MLNNELKPEIAMIYVLVVIACLFIGWKIGQNLFS